MGEAGRLERAVDRKAGNVELRKAGTENSIGYGGAEVRGRCAEQRADRCSGDARNAAERAAPRRRRSGGACDRLGGDPVLFADEERVAPPSGMLTGDKTKTAG